MVELENQNLTKGYGLLCSDIMNYVADIITVQEQNDIRSHLSKCAWCREYFEVYETIRCILDNDAFDSKKPICNTPEGFEAAVMKKIAALPHRIYPIKKAVYVY